MDSERATDESIKENADISVNRSFAETSIISLNRSLHRIRGSVTSLIQRLTPRQSRRGKINLIMIRVNSKMFIVVNCLAKVLWNLPDEELDFVSVSFCPSFHVSHTGSVAIAHSYFWTTKCMLMHWHCQLLGSLSCQTSRTNHHKQCDLSKPLPDMLTVKFAHSLKVWI